MIWNEYILFIDSPCYWTGDIGFWKLYNAHWISWVSGFCTYATHVLNCVRVCEHMWACYPYIGIRNELFNISILTIWMYVLHSIVDIFIIITVRPTVYSIYLYMYCNTQLLFSYYEPKSIRYFDYMFYSVIACMYYKRIFVIIIMYLFVCMYMMYVYDVCWCMCIWQKKKTIIDEPVECKTLLIISQ